MEKLLVPSRWLFMCDLVGAVLFQSRLNLFGRQTASSAFESCKHFFGRAAAYLRKRWRKPLAPVGDRGLVCKLFIHDTTIFVRVCWAHCRDCNQLNVASRSMD